jgi:His-Xaa-Ser system radical SAM maturase HxsC
MNAYLKDYNYGFRIATVARSRSVCNALLQKGVRVMYILENDIIYMPDGVTHKIFDVNRSRINQLGDYDIVEISETGLLYRMFCNREADSTLFMGARCNSNCIMCPAGDAERRKGFSYTREQLLTYIDYLPDDLEYLIITGGEPTMNSSLFIEALNAVKEKFFSTQILLLTNGRSLSVKQFFEKVMDVKPNRMRIAIPIHSDNPTIHDSITRVPGSLEQTLLGVARLMATDVNVEIRIVVTKANCEHLLDIAKLVVSRFPKVFCVNFIGLEPRGNCALNFKQVYIDHRESFLKSKAAIDYLVVHGIDVGLYNYPLCAIDREYWPIAAKSISQYKNEYAEKCDMCAVKSICGGFFTATMQIAPPHVTPLNA